MANRVTGLASGLDTEALVKQMMALSQNKYDNIMKKKTETEWKKQLYNDIYTEMKSLDDKLLKASLSTFNSPRMATSTNEAVATVTASANATNGSYTLKVKELATSANLTGKVGDSSDSSLSGLGLTTGMKLTVTGSKGSEEIEITDEMTSINDLVSAINQADLGVKANYDANNGYFSLKATSTGANEIKLSLNDEDDNPVTGNQFLAALGATAGSNEVRKIGTNAIIELDGATIEQSSNNFTLFGMNFSLKAKSNEMLTVEVKTDNSKLVENVKGLVQSYNSLLELINGKTSEKSYRNYSPLTDEQKKEMSEKEIELWEEKAKSGLLRNDSLLTGLTSKMRTAMYSSYNVDGKFKTLASIGIAQTTYQDKGKLTIDEDKLMKALEEDPDAVTKLFSGEGGLIDTLRGDIKKTMRQLEDKAGAGKIVDTESSLAKQITKYTSQMSTMSAKMVKEENRYYTQFASLEKTLSQMNSNGSYLTSMLGGS